MSNEYKDWLRDREPRDYTDSCNQCPMINKWISVKDRLPEKGNKYYPNEHLISCYDGEKLHKITHWQELPKPPEGE